MCALLLSTGVAPSQYDFKQFDYEFHTLESQDVATTEELSKDPEVAYTNKLASTMHDNVKHAKVDEGRNLTDPPCILPAPAEEMWQFHLHNEAIRGSKQTLTLPPSASLACLVQRIWNGFCSRTQVALTESSPSPLPGTLVLTLKGCRQETAFLIRCGPQGFTPGRRLSVGANWQSTLRAAGLRDGMVLYVKLKETASRVESITDHSPASIDPARVTHSPSTGTNTGAGSTPNSSSLLDEHATMLADKGNPRDITISGISCQVRSQGVEDSRRRTSPVSKTRGGRGRRHGEPREGSVLEPREGSGYTAALQRFRKDFGEKLPSIERALPPTLFMTRLTFNTLMSLIFSIPITDDCSVHV